MTSNLFFGRLVFLSRARGLRVLAAFGVCAAMLPTSSWGAPFTPGNLVVSRVAGGNVFPFETIPAQGDVLPILTPKALAGNGEVASLFIEEYTPTGTLVQSIGMPNFAGNTDGMNHALVLSGTQNGEGQITLSGDGKYFIVTGYNKTPTGAVDGGSNAASSLSVQRVIGRIAMDGTFNTTTALIDAASARSIRSAYSTNGTDFWINGSAGADVTIDTVVTKTSGIKFATLGGTTSSLVAVSGPPNPAANDHRILNVFNGQLYISNSGVGATNANLLAVGTGVPSSADQLLTGLPGLTTNQLDDYWFKDATTLYTADNRRRADLNGGVRKYAFEDTDGDLAADSWVFKYHVQLGVQEGPTLNATEPNVGARGLAGRVDGSGNTVLFATTLDDTGGNRNRLVRIEDNGTAMTYTNLATSAFQDPAGSQFATAFRGVEVVPAASAINANFDGLNGVDGNDLLIWQRGLGTSGGLGQGDSNASGSVDATDLVNWRARYGNANASAVPEPSSAVLAVLAGLALAAKRRW